MFVYLKPVCAVVFLLCLISCDSDRVYESNVKIPDHSWYRLEKARFQVEITDTISVYNLYVNIRNNSEYRWSNLWLFVNVQSPAGVVQRDTLQIVIADQYGKWTGNGLGDKYDNRMLFGKNVYFPASGTYTFEYEQAMREDPVIGIEDVGLRVEKAVNVVR